MEPKITLRGRQADSKIIQSVLPPSVQKYKQETGNDVEITLDVENFLPADSCGGVELYSLQGRIKVS
jgi:V-type H+-transporting ATPase subunit E